MLYNKNCIALLCMFGFHRSGLIHCVNICDWIYVNCFKLHIESYEIINFKDFKTL